MENNKIDFATCPEIILFYRLNTLVNKKFELIHKKNSNSHLLQEISNEMNEIFKNLDRFGIPNSKNHYNHKNEEFSEELNQWYSLWFNYFNYKLSLNEFQELKKDLQKWIDGEFVDLSKWQIEKNITNFQN